MLTKFLVVLIYFSSYQCQELETDSLNIRHHFQITKEPSQRKVITRRDADLTIESQSTKPKFFICCEPGQFFEKGQCFANSTVLINNLTFPSIYTDALEKSEINPWTHFDIQYNYPCKKKSYTLNPNSPKFDIFNILENGKIFLNNSMFKMRNSMKNNDAYCLANLRRKNGTYSVIRFCFREYSQDVPSIYPITMSMSIPFLVATFLVYACLPALKNIHGLTLMSYVACLCTAYICLVVVQFGGQEVVQMKTLCTRLAFAIYFSFLAAFLWLNVMCFDIWITFRELRCIHSNLVVSHYKRKKFIIYSVYAWGLASLLTGTGIIMDLVPGIPDNLVKPQFGQQKCWFHDKKGAAIYFYGPAGITITCNVFFFISTAFNIRQHNKITKLQMRKSDSRRHDNNKRWFSLYLKLCIVMGMNWSMEIMSWYFMKEEIEQHINLWVIPDLGNTLQGISIFIIFIWTDKVKKLLFKKIGRGNWNSQSSSSTKNNNSMSRVRISTATPVSL